jgi:hypothetical protein
MSNEKMHTSPSKGPFSDWSSTVLQSESGNRGSSPTVREGLRGEKNESENRGIGDKESGSGPWGISPTVRGLKEREGKSNRRIGESGNRGIGESGKKKIR